MQLLCSVFILIGISKKNNFQLEETIRELKPIYKEELLKCAITWNVNSKNCQVAQVNCEMRLNILFFRVVYIIIIFFPFLMFMLIGCNKRFNG